MTRASASEDIMIKRFVTIAILGATMLTAACNTIEGAGKDVSSVGDTVSDAAK
jgi:predicted small secreted protein